MSDEPEGEPGPVAGLPLLEAGLLPELPAGEVERRQALRAGNRGMGRVAGVPNRRTVLWAEHILRTRQSPLVMLAETYSRPVADLAAELHCSLLEAFQLQQRAAVELAPYLHGKMPVAIDLNGKTTVELNLVLPSSGAGTAHVLDVEFQGVGDDVGQSDVGQRAE